MWNDLNASSLKDNSLRPYIESTNLIVLGKVTQIDVRLGLDKLHQEHLYTYVTIKIDEILKGDYPTESLELRQLGGVTEDKSLVVPGSYRFVEGQSGLFFLIDSIPDGSYPLRTSGFWHKDQQWVLSPIVGGKIKLEDFKKFLPKKHDIIQEKTPIIYESVKNIVSTANTSDKLVSPTGSSDLYIGIFVIFLIFFIFLFKRY